MESLEHFALLQIIPQPQRQVNHCFTFRHNLCSAGETPKVMPCVAIVAFDCASAAFADNMTVFWKHLGKGAPVICVKLAVF
jgi:hypothetical protein